MASSSAAPAPAPAPAPPLDAAKRGELEQALAIAEPLIQSLRYFEKVKGWPGIRKRPKGQDDDESQEDLSDHQGEYTSGDDDVSDPSASEETGSDDPLGEMRDPTKFNPVAKINKWVPVWCKPDHRDVRRTRATVKLRMKTGKPMLTITARRDFPHLVMRPAVLDKDQKHNPTLYARRFGMDPDAEPEGRSRFSPTISATRRVPIENSLRDTGAERFVGMAELDYACQNGVDALLNGIADSTEGDPNHDEYMALKELFETLADDHDYQRVTLNTMTTDDSRRYKIHNPEDPDMAFGSDLQGPLHPLLETIRWARDRSANKHVTPYYDFGPGNSGEWTVHSKDQRVWMALQAPLQLATRIISIHPMYHTIWDVFNRRPVAQHRLAPASQVPEQHRANRPPMYIHQDESNRPLLATYQEEAAFKKTGYDVAQRIYEILRDKVTWEVGDVGEHFQVGDKYEPYGITVYPNFPDDPVAKILIALPPHNIWPLMHPEFTMSEKGVLARFVAGVVVHELAHACHAATRIFMRPSYINSRPDLDAKSKQLLTTVIKEINPQEDLWDMIVDLDPWFNEEPEGEIGFATENQIFGGALGNAVWWDPRANETLGDLNFIQQSFEPWPCAKMHHDRYDQKMGFYGKAYLTEPRPPIDRMHKVLPAAEHTKFFQQKFWDADVAKYGHASFLMYSDGEPCITLADFSHKPDNVLAPVFGVDTYNTLLEAISKLLQGGYVMTARYISELLQETALEPLELERWTLYFERRPFLDRRINSLQMHFNLLRDDLPYMEAEAQVNAHKLQFIRVTLPFTSISNLQEYEDHLKECKTRVKKVIFGRGREFHLTMLAHLEEAQIIVLKMFMMPKRGREAIQTRFKQQFIDAVAKYENILNTIAGTIDSVYRAIKGNNLHNTADYKDLMDEIPEFRKKLAMTRNSFKEVRTRFAYRARSVQGIDDYVPQFTAAPARRLFRHARLIEAVACREIYKMPKLIRTVVDKAIELMLIHARKTQGRATIKSDLQRVAKLVKAAKARDWDLVPERDFQVSLYAEMVDTMTSQKGGPPAPPPIGTYFKPAKDPDAMSIDYSSASSVGSPMEIDPNSPVPSRPATPPPPAPTPSFLLPDGTSFDWIKNIYGGENILQDMATHNWAFHIGPSPPLYPAPPNQPVVPLPQPPQPTPPGQPVQPVPPVPPVQQGTAAPRPRHKPRKPATKPDNKKPTKKGPRDQGWKPPSSNSSVSSPSPSDVLSSPPEPKRPKKKSKPKAPVTTVATKEVTVKSTSASTSKSKSKSKKRAMVRDDDGEWRPAGDETTHSSDDYVEEDIEDKRRRKKARRAVDY